MKVSVETQPSLSQEEKKYQNETLLLAQQYMELVENLPEGWQRNPQAMDRPSGGRVAPPFVHASGTVSWKNPNHDKIQAFMKQQQESKRKAMLGNAVEYQVRKISNPTMMTGNDVMFKDKHQQVMVKKLRLMLQVGAPLEAVKRRAAVENVDMSLVLQEKEYNRNDDTNEEENVSPTNSQSVVVVSPYLLKKYIRMRKMGVGLAQVQQLAYIEAMLEPQQVVDLLAMQETTTNKINKETKQEGDGGSAVAAASPANESASSIATKNMSTMSKYRRMYQVGLPWAAIVQAATVDGVVTTEELDQTLLSNHLQDDKTPVGAKANDKTVTEASSSKTPLDSASVPKSMVDKFFTVMSPNKVAFEANSDLALLVRKMVHTVDKMSRSCGTSEASSSLVVDVLTLYHALGSLQGVQVARNDYNETCDIFMSPPNSSSTPKDYTLAWFKAKRQAFTELARSIGLKIPMDLSSRVHIAGLDELIAFLKQRFANDIADVKLLIEQGFYDFDSLAYMYMPGSRVVAKNAGGGGVDMICRVAWNRYQQGKSIMGQPTKYFQVCFEYVVAVGAKSATIAEVVEGMEAFDGKRSLLGGLLQFVPWCAYSAEQQEALSQRYRLRGEVYNQVALNADTTDSSKSYSYKAYSKGSFFVKHGGGAGPLVGSSGNPSGTGGRIIVDNQGAFDSGHSLSIGYDPMITGIKYKVKEYKLQLRENDTNTRKKKLDDDNPTDDGNGMIMFQRIPDDFLEYVWPYVVGFSLSARAWGDCLVDGLYDIEFSEDIFDRLVLPESQKRLVKALVKHSSVATSSGGGFRDLVAGKGEGIVFLLYGPPGVGKTLSAEAVAEVLQRPLFSVSMGTLGTTADELEKRLSEILKLSAKWDAIVLLDEADSFLETRSSNSSLERNAMVSVMLKLVEYFSGILFLTSNRFDSLDPAFQTRITLSLKFENLDAVGREMVWENLFSKSGIETGGTLRIDSRELAQFPLNGREIKNALRLGLALAAEENRPLSQDILMETAAMINPVEKEKEHRGKKRYSFFGKWRN